MKKEFLSEESLETPEINLTPLIDVVFVILIMFIVVVPLLEVDRVALPPSLSQEKSAVKSTHSINLHVYEDNSLMLDGKIVSIEELGPRLALARKESDTLTLFHDKSASFGTYQIIKQSAESAGFQELDVILTKK